ncbi:MAG TPA: rRNA adenine N-6-methyltransferase family protein, partial [Vicinamibacterales bacterium]|nr:rRNA adenine N-6-methyltransferase family protein [Vicinamibacterales bacterium]
DLLDPRGTGYHPTKDDDPRRIYHNIAVAIDSARQLNNGHPGTLATWIESLGIHSGDRVVHIGAGTGYYTAIMAEVCGASGAVLALEADANLAARAADNLRPWTNVRVIHDDAVTLRESADAIFVNAGVTYALPAWLDALAEDGGRMVIPVTAAFGPLGKGAVVRIERKGDRFQARGSSLVMIYNCSIARDDSMAAAIGKAMTTGGFSRVRSVRRESHEEDPTCVIHREGCCLSTEAS